MIRRQHMQPRLRSNQIRYSFLFLSITLLVSASGGCHPRSNNTMSPFIKEVTASGHHFSVAAIFLSKSTLRLFWKKPDGARIGTFDNLNSLVSNSGDRLLFAANAGIFDTTFSPCGLYVQDGQEFVPLNLSSGTGNFYMKPNGIFLIDSSGAAIIESGAYPSVLSKPRLATQSGPLLLSNGQISPEFSPDSDNRHIRSGIGVISTDHVVFAISRDPVTFYEFAMFFKTALNCRDALYLDGAISKFYPDPTHTSDSQEAFAGMFAVTEHN
jgi:uncharacterized protein YigE (DUF2233 family)